jgi:ParB family chromosome partitioning protein
VARVPDLWPVGKIRVEGRYRHDLGDLSGLKASIRDQGLINPITIDENGRLLAGGRRLAAVTELGYTDVQVHVIATLGDALKELQIEEAENLHRKELTLSERVKQGEAIRRVLTGLARERQGTRTDLQPSIGKDGKSRAAFEASVQTARALGMGGTNYRAIRAIQSVVDNPQAHKTDREAAAAALREIDAGGSVQGVSEAFRTRNAGRSEVAEATPLHHQVRRRRIREQRERFDGLATQVNGMKMGIDGMLRDEFPLIEPDMAKVAQWVSDLQGARRSINDLVKRLKEITA